MAEGIADVCVCVLFYGAEDKHFKLAQRVLNEPMRRLAERNVEFRFGCNAVGAATTSYLLQQIATHFHRAVLFHSPENIMKYPMMRRMLHEPPIRAPITMWFDHDSYLNLNADDNIDAWLGRVIKNVNGCNFIGSVYKQALSTAHLDWLANQPWFNPAYDKKYLSYIVGGWWTIKTDLLRKFDWPPQDLQQKGGDALLGAMFKHQDLPFCHFRDGVRVNVNDAGVESAEPRTIDL
jgi:hypothetical protein